MICLIALITFAALALFSVRYRPLAREAFECVTRRMMFRPCETRFDQRMKAKIVAKVLSKSPGAARFVNKNFEALSWAFTLLFFATLVYTIYAAYNLFVFGTCTPEAPWNCPFAVDAARNVTNATCPGYPLPPA